MSAPDRVATTSDVWDVICEDNPDLAADFRLRSQLIRQLSHEVRSWGLTYREAAVKAKMTPAQISNLLNGHIDKFSLSFLIRITVRIGLEVTISVYKRVPEPSTPPA